MSRPLSATTATASSLLVATLAATPLGAEDTAGLDFFETEIRPLLAQHCYECHSAEAGKLKANLYLDSRAGWETGGDSGPALIPGKPDESILIKAVTHANGDLEMPPKQRLSGDEIGALRKWIAMGAPDPRSGEVRKPAPEIDLEKGREFWSFKMPVAPPVPAVADDTWPAGDIDRFILARLEDAGLPPAADTSRRSLLRRLHYDLTGFPPTPEEMAAFLADESPEAFRKAVDDLLARPEFGERWGRHWLDVARFAESSGGGRSLVFREAWRYRDYVIASFNENKPYDEFVREQLAGDVLPHRTPDQRNEQLVGSGYLVLGAINYELQDQELLEMEIVDEQIDAMGRTFLGMTLGCARCHDHKFDPIPTTDYYALAGIFQSTRSLGEGSAATGVSSIATTPLEVADKEKVDALRKQVTGLDKDISRLKKAIKEQRGPEPVSKVPPPAQEQLKALEKKRKNLAGQLKKLQPVAMAPGESSEPADGHVHIRGQVRNKGPEVPRGFLSVAMAPEETADIAADSSGRRELAEWIASPDHPLTARVMVNRVWMHLLGEGLVRTPDNFGTTGERPSHPDLLDHLALQSVEDDWSVKSLVRSIVLSRTYRLSTGPDHAADPENRLFGRAHRRKLDAEAIRDTVLLVSGQLDRTRGGFTVGKIGQYDLNYTVQSDRRSVYVPRFRNSVLDLFEVFDAANPNLVVGKRPSTNLPTQALFLMNSRFIREQSERTAQRLLDDKASPGQAYELLLCRPPTADEREATAAFLAGFSPDEQLEAWTQLCQTLFACLDFRHLD